MTKAPVSVSQLRWYWSFCFIDLLASWAVIHNYRTKIYGFYWPDGMCDAIKRINVYKKKQMFATFAEAGPAFSPHPQGKNYCHCQWSQCAGKIRGIRYSCPTYEGPTKCIYIWYGMVCESMNSLGPLRCIKGPHNARPHVEISSVSFIPFYLSAIFIFFLPPSTSGLASSVDETALRVVTFWHW